MHTPTADVGSLALPESSPLVPENKAEKLSSLLKQTFNQSALKPLERLSKGQMTLGVLGGVCAVLSAAVAVPLSYEFGKWLVESLGGSGDLAKEMTGVSFAIITPIPIAVLSGRHSADVFSELAVIIEPKYRTLFRHKKTSEVVGEVYYDTVAFIAALSEAYNTYDHFFKQMAYWSLTFIIPDIISPAILCRWSFINLNKYCFNRLMEVRFFRGFIGSKKTEVDKQRDYLKSLVKKIEVLFKKKSDEEINFIFSNMQRLFNDNENSGDVKNILASIFNMAESQVIISSQSNNGIVPVAQSGFMDKFVKGVGFGVGVISSWFYFPLARDANTAIMNWVKGDILVYPYVAASSTFLCRAGIQGLANFEKFHDTYQRLKQVSCSSIHGFFKAAKNVALCNANQDEKERIKAVFYVAVAILVSAISTSARAENYREYAETNNQTVDDFFIAITMLGVFTTRVWSLTTFADICKQKLDDSNRAKLLYFCGRLTKIIDGLSDDAVGITYDQVLNADQGSDAVSRLNF